MTRRYLRAGDFSPEKSWDLLRWVHELGADRFSLSFFHIEGAQATLLDEIEAALVRFSEPRSVVTENRAQPRVWVLTEASMETLRSYLVDGLFTQPSYQENGWAENLTCYRRGTVVLSVDSVEGEARLELSEDEIGQLESAGFVGYRESMWGL